MVRRQAIGGLAGPGSGSPSAGAPLPDSLPDPVRRTSAPSGSATPIADIVLDWAWCDRCAGLTVLVRHRDEPVAEEACPDCRELTPEEAAEYQRLIALPPEE